MGEATAAVLHGVEDLQIETFAIPEVGPEDAVLKVEACGLCGTDHELYTGHIPAPYPVIPGHETVGTIESIGEIAAAKWQVDVGDRVAVECWQACGECEQCRTGIYRRCVRHGQTDLYGMIPTERDTQPGDYVAVLGPGIRGLCALVATRDAGAEFVAVTGYGANDHPRLEMAEAMGADLVIDVAEEDPARKFRDATGGRLADVVVDVTANAPTAFGQAVRISAVDATIVMAGVRGQKGAPDLHADAIIWKELTVRGALGVDAPVYRKALDLLEQRKFPFDLFSRREVGLDETSDLLATMAGNGDAPPPVHGVIVPGL